jgi:hypothetical protein
MGIGDYIVLAIILYLLFRIVRYILVSVWLWLVTIWIRWKFRHVVPHARATPRYQQGV